MDKARLIFIHCLYLAKLNPILRIGDKDQLVKRWDNNQEIAVSSPLYFSSKNIRFLAYVFTGGDP